MTTSLENISLEDRYRLELDAGHLIEDEAQRHAIDLLQALSIQLEEDERRRQNRGLLSRLGSWLTRDSGDSVVKGLYFWGGVGRGKTLLMDMFFDSLTLEKKLRLHFHRFMQYVHKELTRLQGESDPLIKIASDLADKYNVICLDEFFVKDITDAMILAGLLDALFQRRVVLVTTSNIAPSGLYKDGLQRARFLPAIDLLEQYTKVVNLDGGVDYRLRTLERAELYHYPLDDQADKSLLRSFRDLAPDAKEEAGKIEVLGRDLEPVLRSDDIIWFDFQELCGGPRSQNDYIELAKLYHAVLISNVPVMGRKTDDWARRFINLIDEFYDRNVKVIISAEAPVEGLYQDGLLQFEFERTRSRLLEMQSHEYLAREHNG